MQRVDVGVVRSLHEQARGGKVGRIRSVHAEDGICERSVSGVERRFVVNLSPREPRLRLVLNEVEVLD